MRKALLIPFLIAATYLSTESQAQDFTKKFRYTSFGVSVGAANYSGDLSPSTSFFSTDLELTRPSMGIFAVRKFFPRVSGRVSLSIARLKGDDKASASPSEANDAGRWERNLSFRNDVKELAVVGIYDLKPNFGHLTKRNEYIPYFFGGVAVFYQNPKTYYNGNLMKEGWYNLQPLQTEGKHYSKTQFAIPFGMGMRLRLNEEMDLGFELGWRKTFTDYLDDVSATYANKGNLNKANGTASWVLSDRSIELSGLANQRGVELGEDDRLYPITYASGGGQARGNAGVKDWYFIGGFNLSYTPALKIKNPKFK